MSKKMEKGTENAIFLDGREYTAADLYRLIGLLVGNGVYANELATTATNEDMSITHGAGHAWISGVAYWNTTPFVLEIATADGSLNRYDSLMLRLNLSINEVYAVIVQGAYATNPAPPACTRNAETFDLKLCDIYVPAGCTKITQDQITDTRLDSSVCGVPVFPVEHMDMTSFYRQIATDLANFQQGNEAEFSAWVEDQKDSNLATLAALVEVVRNTSDGSVAEIEALLQQLNELVDSDTVGELTNAINDKLPKSGGTMTGDIAMGGNRITDMGAPTDSADAATKGYVDTAVRKAAPRNLMDNSDFRNPVNQRGISITQSLYTFDYTIDRWRIYGGTDGGKSGIRLTDNGVTISLGGSGAYFDQLLHLDVSKTYTFVAETDDGIYLVSGVPSTGCENAMLKLETNKDGYLRCAFINISKDHNIHWAALYEGEFTADTLPEYRPKGYGAELAECMRYYYKEDTAHIVNSGKIETSFLAKMRVIPTVTVTSWGGYKTTIEYVSSWNCVIGGFDGASGVAGVTFEASADL